MENPETSQANTSIPMAISARRLSLSKRTKAILSNQGVGTMGELRRRLEAEKLPGQRLNGVAHREALHEGELEHLKSQLQLFFAEPVVTRAEREAKGEVVDVPAEVHRSDDEVRAEAEAARAELAKLTAELGDLTTAAQKASDAFRADPSEKTVLADKVAAQRQRNAEDALAKAKQRLVPVFGREESLKRREAHTAACDEEADVRAAIRERQRAHLELEDKARENIEILAQLAAEHAAVCERIQRFGTQLAPRPPRPLSVGDIRGELQAALALERNPLSSTFQDIAFWFRPFQGGRPPAHETAWLNLPPSETN